MDVNNLVHRFCIQYVYKKVFDRRLISFQSAWNVHNLRTENNRSPRQLWLEGMLQNYNTTSTAVQDVFETNMNLHERLSESLRILGVDVSTPIINHDNIDSFSSNFTASLDLNEVQKMHLENIITLDKSDREKYTLCVDLLMS